MYLVEWLYNVRLSNLVLREFSFKVNQRIQILSVNSVFSIYETEI